MTLRGLRRLQPATVAAVCLVGVVSVAWSWEHGRVDGQTLLVLLGLAGMGVGLAALDLALQRERDPFGGKR